MPAPSDLMGLDLDAYGQKCAERRVAQHAFAREVLEQLDADDKYVATGLLAGVVGLAFYVLLIAAVVGLVVGAYLFFNR